MNIEIAIQGKNGEVIRKTVEAWPVTIPGYEKFSFACNCTPLKLGWNITEVSSGYKIGTGVTRGQALRDAIYRLTDKSPEKLQWAIDKARKE